VRRHRDVGHGLLVRLHREVQLEDPDRLSTVGHRSEYAPAVGAVLDLDRLAGERAPVRGSPQGHAVGGLASTGARGR
jgi:hypothetical protein